MDRHRGRLDCGDRCAQPASRGLVRRAGCRRRAGRRARGRAAGAGQRGAALRRRAAHISGTGHRHGRGHRCQLPGHRAPGTLAGRLDDVARPSLVGCRHGQLPGRLPGLRHRTLARPAGARAQLLPERGRGDRPVRAACLCPVLAGCFLAGRARGAHDTRPGARRRRGRVGRTGALSACTTASTTCLSRACTCMSPSSWACWLCCRADRHQKSCRHRESARQRWCIRQANSIDIPDGRGLYWRPLATRSGGLAAAPR